MPYLSLEEERVQATDLILLLDQYLEVLIDDGDGEEDTRSAANGAQEVGEHGERANAQASEGGRRRNVAVELVDHGLIAVAAHDHLLLLELLGDVLGARAAHVYPRLGEEGARAEHEDDVEHGVDGIVDHRLEVLRRREIVAQATDRVGASRAGAAHVRPHAEQVDEEVAGKLGRQHLRDHVQVGDESALQHDGYVAGVEELDRVGARLAAEARRLDGQVDTEALEVDDNGEDEHGGEQVGQIGQVLAIEGLLERAHLVVARGQQVEESDDGALELGAAAGVDGRRAKGLPHNRLADVRGNEERDARAETVALLQELVEQQHDETGDEELHDDEEADGEADLARLAVHARHDVDDRLADRDHHAEHYFETRRENNHQKTFHKSQSRIEPLLKVCVTYVSGRR